MAYSTALNQNQNPPVQIPTVDVAGRVVYKAGPWGSKYPARKISADILVTDHPAGTINFEGSGLGDNNGKFRAKSGSVGYAFSRITLQIREDFTGQTSDLTLYPGLIGPNQGPQNVGDIVFPFEPAHAELGWIGNRPMKSTQDIAKTLSGMLRSADKRVSLDLLSEWRGTETIPVDQLVDDRLPRVTGVNGRTFEKPVTRGTQEEIRQRKQEDARFIRERLKSFRPVPLVTPAQKLLKMLSVQGFAKDFPQRVVKEIFTRRIVPGKPGPTVDALAAILDNFSLVTIPQLEGGNLLRRIVAGLQRAGKATFHFETIFEEAAADMSAACAIVFLAGFMAKNNAEPRVDFNYWHKFSMSPGVLEERPFVKISISAGK
jgi:hypothetical protein